MRVISRAGEHNTDMIYLNRSTSKIPAWQLLSAVGVLLFVAIGVISLLKSANTIPPATGFDAGASGSNAGTTAPSSIEKIPEDLKNPALQYAGVFEDGWLSESPTFTLSQPIESNALIIRGMVPDLGTTGFVTQLQASVDNQLVGGENLGVGNFELALPLPTGSGQRRIQLTFSEKQLLANGDGRPVGALLHFIGFETRHDLTAKLPSDITESGISLGYGWYLPEETNGTAYRWVNNQAELTIAAPDTDDPQALHLELEPGPGLDLKPFELKFLNFANNIVAQRTITGRQTLKILLPTESGASTVYKLKVDGGGKTIAGEKRILNFRVFHAKLGMPAPDIATLKDGLALGTGWYDPETVRGKTFRWVNNDAELSITAPATQSTPLSLEVEPGPGLSNKPFDLQLLSATGSFIAKASVTSHEQIKFKLPTPPGKTESFKLHVEGGGKTTTGETRILNFRVFNVSMGSPSGPDIVPPRAILPEAANLEIGENWYAAERHEGTLYRWVNNDAELVVRMPQTGKAPVLVLELESGPGLDRKPFVIQARNNAGGMITQADAKEAGVVNLALPFAPGQTEAIKLHVDGGGRQIPNENRILNFRVFKARLSRPVDLTVRRNLLKTGMYEDGWVTTKAAFQIPQLKTPALLTVRGVIPMLADKNYTTEVRLLVDNKEIAKKTFVPGDFELQAPPPAGAGNRSVSLFFSKSQVLPGEDQRLVGGLLRYVGFDAPANPDATADPGKEITLPANGVTFGEGWYPVEVQQTVPFRWVSNNAELRLTPPTDGQRALNLTLEPGPGVGSKPFELLLLDANKKIISTVTVRGKETIRFAVPMITGKGKTLYYLRVREGGQATPNDFRTLNFRVFKIEWSKP